MRVLLAAVCVAAYAVAAPVPKVVAKATALDGRWECVELNANNSDVTKLNPWVWEVEGEKLNILHRRNGRLTPNETNTTTTLVRPTGAAAGEVDYVRDDGTTKLVFKGLVSVVGDELTICWSDPGLDRPTEAKAGKTVHYLRFTRITDK